MKRLTLALLLILFTSFIATAGFDPNADRCVRWTWKWAADYKTRIVVCLEWKKAYKPSKKLTTADGTIMYTFDGKLHNWEGPALIPEGNNRRREYYINGIKYTEEKWKEMLQSREGLPWYKGSGARF